MMISKESDLMKELERKPYSSEAMRVRCPHCRKLYLVQFTDVQESKPRFECVQCRTRFWLSLADMDLSNEVVGLPVQLKEAPQKKPVPSSAPAAQTETCPKCFKMIRPGLNECNHCGVLLSKMKELTFQEDGPAHSKVLAAHWQKLVGAYDNETLHDEFLLMAQREGHLPYAAAQYGQMLKLMPADETTMKRVRAVNTLASNLVPSVDKSRRRKIFGRLWQMPLVAAVMMMLFGMVLPVFRNMVGVGAALLFVALAMQIQFRPRG